MKELRSAVNAVFLFAVFLLFYAALTPGRARGSAHPPRFLRMQVEDLRHDTGKRLSISVPYFFIGNALRFAALGRLHRELDVHFDEQIESEDLRSIWEELKTKPEGEEVVREHGHDIARLKRDGSTILLEYSHKDDSDGEKVRIKIPARLMEAAVTDGRDFDVDSLLSELRAAKVGDLVEVSAPDAHVKVWIE